MLINEVCKKCKLTKKAIEYYEEQRMIQPKLLENGYRDFSEQDVERLHKIAILRGLGLSLSEIRPVLGDEGKTALSHLSSRKAVELHVLRTKQELVQELALNQDWEAVRMQLETLEKKQTVLERMIHTFPGYYGRYMSLHFAMYLNEPIGTEEQQEAFETIVAFLDNVSLEIPGDIQEYLDEAFRPYDENTVASISENMNKAVHNIEEFMADHKEVLEQYMEFKQSDEYKESPAYRLEEFFRSFNSTSGYQDIFIPAMKRLSKSYRDYQIAIGNANKVLLEKYPAAAMVQNSVRND